MTSLMHLAANTSENSPKRSLVLSGGGMRLSYQAGALLALEEAGLTFNHFDATSGGSMNLSMLFSGLSPSQMCERWDNLNMMDSVAFLPLDEYIDANNLKGLGSADTFRSKVFPHLGIEPKKVNQIDNVIGTYNVLDYADKEVSVIGHTDIDEDMMIAGISLPGVFPPVVKNNKSYLDTAFIQDANLMEAVRQGAEEIWLLWGLGNTGNYQGGALNIYIQMLETSANGALNNELNQINELNRRILNNDSPFGQTKPIEINIIQPRLPLPLDPDLYLGKITNCTLIDMGYADAKQYLKNRSPDGMIISKNMTRMNEPEPGLRFCEGQSGTLKFTDGQTSDTNLDITIHITSFEKFMKDPERKERITGRLTIDSIVKDKIMDNGTFYINFSENNPELKVINYEVTFSNDGVTYNLIGNKEIFDDPGMDFLEDISTIFVSLYRVDGSAPIATGNLRLSLKELAKQATSIRTTNVDSAIESAKMIAQFTAFCLKDGARETSTA